MVCYERKLGTQYLLKTLQEPLQNIQVLLEHCEINLEKLKEIHPEFNKQQLEEVLMWNTRNLESSCLLLFEAVFGSREDIPARILAMCAFIDHCVRETTNTDKNFIMNFDLMRQPLDLGGIGLAVEEESATKSAEQLNSHDAFGSNIINR